MFIEPSARPTTTPRLYEIAEEIEQAVTDVQLFGTPHQVSLVRQFATDLGTLQTAEMNDLLVELRDSLRAELGADPLSSRHLWLRVGRKKDGAPEETHQAP